MREYTTIEFAQKLGLTYRQVRYLMEQGKVKARRVDGARTGYWLIPASEVYKIRRKMQKKGLQKSQSDI